MPLRNKPCLVCGETHEYNSDYITCEAREMMDKVVEISSDQWEVIQKYLSAQRKSDD